LVAGRAVRVRGPARKAFEGFFSHGDSIFPSAGIGTSGLCPGARGSLIIAEFNCRMLNPEA
jgi:hypothetical protein